MIIEFLLMGQLLLAQSDAATLSETESNPTQLEALRVTGMQEEELNQNIAPKRVGKEVIDEGRITDVSRALKSVPGVYVREEEGQGLRPNIGLRGTNPDRSKKVVIMEDEVLSGPAPYSAPAAYYTPSIFLAEELEIYRGFAAMAYGPNSIGGAVNYLGYAIPSKPTHWVDVGYGSFNSLNTRLFTGSATSWGGYTFQFGRIASDGFKKIDNGDFAGFDRDDAKLKLRYDLPEVDGKIQNLELSLGIGQEDSHETYLGLEDSDYEADPYRRYNSSALDEMKWRRHSARLDYVKQTSDTGVLKTSLYWHQFARTWYRFDRFRSGSVGVANVLANPSSGVNAVFMDILRGAQDSSAAGATDGQIVMASNDRTFISQGLQMSWNEDYSFESHKHKLRILGRLHQDQIDRDHTYDYYEMVGGEMQRTADARLVDRENRESTVATSLSIQDDIEFGNNVVTLVGRAENADFKFLNKLTDVEEGRNDSYFAPGAGYLRRLNPNWSTRVSVNQAVTIAGLDPSGADKREESINYEWGLKYLADNRQREANITVFYNDYQNITGTCTASGGCSSANLDTQLNGGKARVMGVEARVAQGFDWGSSYFPIQLNVTYLNAELETEFTSSDGEWGVGEIKKGDPMPYIPNLQYALILGHELGKFKQRLSVIYQGHMYSQSAEVGRKEIPGYGILDWNAHYDWSKSVELFGKVDNLLNKNYLVAYRPFGARPGKPQSFMVGLRASF